MTSIYRSMLYILFPPNELFIFFRINQLLLHSLLTHFSLVSLILWYVIIVLLIAVIYIVRISLIFATSNSNCISLQYRLGIKFRSSSLQLFPFVKIIIRKPLELFRLISELLLFIVILFLNNIFLCVYNFPNTIYLSLLFYFFIMILFKSNIIQIITHCSLNPLQSIP